ncbi:hypothetical protein [Deinococcus wulumuqiensis]|uniref:hypothetical protein n=1 Tax=Deinococcus wulumuqiensis TaxID=980427 RepID=UPI00242C34B1|nr:hypothetical protein [Deinococcus wulumuqiensis]
MNASIRQLPRATSLVEAARMQARYSGRHRHVIVVGNCTEQAEEYFVVTESEATRLYAQGLEPLWLKS